MVIKIYAIVLFYGMATGSFLNVVAMRGLKDESIIPGSRCPSCDKKIKLYDNIPVLSFLMLRGKCRNCKSKISPIYPIFELVMGLLFLIIYNLFGFTIEGLVAIIMLSAIIVSIITNAIKDKLSGKINVIIGVFFILFPLILIYLLDDTSLNKLVVIAISSIHYIITVRAIDLKYTKYNAAKNVMLIGALLTGYFCVLYLMA